MQNAPTFNWKYNKFQLEPFVAFGAANGGAPRVQVFIHNKIDNKDYLIFDQFVFEDTFRGGVSVALTQTGDLIAGSGFGGAPRVRTFKNINNQYYLVKDEFVADSSLRTGIWFNANATPFLGYRDQTTQIVPKLNQQIYFAVPYPGFPGNTLEINKLLNNIPLSQQHLFQNNIIVYVHNQRSITDLPYFAYLKGQETINHGDGPRKWDSISALAYANICLISQFDIGNTIHELGHCVQFKFDLNDAEWQYIYKNTKFPSEYERSSPLESFAESYKREIFGTYNDPKVKKYLREKLPW